MPELVESFDLVTARSFGPPAVTAECGVQFLRIGGVMIVSEPPDDTDSQRWNIEKLAELGLSAEAVDARCRVSSPREDPHHSQGVP